MRRAEGAVIETADGQTYLDMFMAHGSTVVGHGHPSVMQAVRDSLSDGVVVGYETGLGEVVANRIVEMVPSAEAVRFTASGSEAVGSAMRLARAHTGRDVIIKIDGHFHGGTDYAMVNSLAANTDRDNPGGRPSRAILSSGGIPVSVTESVVPVPWNDLPALEAAFAAHPDQVAGVIMVPIDFNNGCITTTAEYLAAALEMSHRHGALLIFDEILSGFKTGPGGAQALYGVLPDLTLLSKCVSSGVPLSVLCGRSEVMDTLMLPPPAGAIQGGTFAGNIMGLAAAGATLDLLSAPSFYPELLARSERFFRQLQGIFDASPHPGAGAVARLHVHRVHGHPRPGHQLRADAGPGHRPGQAVLQPLHRGRRVLPHRLHRLGGPLREHPRPGARADGARHLEPGVSGLTGPVAAWTGR